MIFICDLISKEEESISTTRNAHDAGKRPFHSLFSLIFLRGGVSTDRVLAVGDIMLFGSSC